MSYINDHCMEENNVIYIDGRKEELFPGLNTLMARMAELYIENYMDPEYIERLDGDETIVIDYTALSEKEMSELVKCAIKSMKFEESDRDLEILLS